MAKRKDRKLVVKNSGKSRKVQKNREHLVTSGAGLQWKRPVANQKYKDTVFRMLFSDRKNLLALYNAVNGSAYKDVSNLEIVTLGNAVYMGMKNDLAFIIDLNVFLYEHQSTYNPNMPLRDLFYISREYQKLVDQKSLYSSTLQKIPAPNFMVFYNGTERNEDSWTDYLSAAYENPCEEPNLELKVVTLNINEGHNERLMEDCRILKEYAQYVARVRNYKGEMDLDAAVERAVKECIHEGILEQFLRENRAEVIAMSIFEYDQEEEERKLRKAEFEAGVASGIEQEKEVGIRNLIDLAQEAGISPEKTKQRLQEYYNLNSRHVKKYMEKFWENYVEVDSVDIEEDAVIGNGIFRYVKEEEERKLRKAEFEAGVASGIERGIEQGKELEKESGIRNLIDFAQEIGSSPERTKLRLQEYYNLSSRDVKKYMERFWENYVEDDSDDTEEDAVIGNGIFRYNQEEEERKLRKAEFEAGVASGIEQGKELEKESGIRNLIHFAQELGLSQEKLRLRLMECYKLSEEAADDYTRKYWKDSKD